MNLASVLRISSTQLLMIARSLDPASESTLLNQHHFIKFLQLKRYKLIYYALLDRYTKLKALFYLKQFQRNLTETITLIYYN